MFVAGHIHGRSYNMLMSAKLDRLAVGSILKQEKVFLISVLSMRMQIRTGHRPLHNLVAGIRRELQQRTDDGWALIMRVIK